MANVADPLSSVLVNLADKAQLSLTIPQAAQLSRYLRTLAIWNQRINLTSLDLRGFPESSLLRLVVEPLKAARHLPTRRFRWFDLGSGGGSPAIPLRVMAPEAVLTMVESRGRKAAFLREAVRVCELERTDVTTTRIEDLARETELGSVDVITVRAVRIDGGVAETVSALSSPEACVILFGGGDWSTLESSFVESADPAPEGVTLLVRQFHVEHRAPPWVPRT